MIKLDTRYPETLIFNLSLSGTRDPSQATARMIIKIDDSYSLSIHGENDGEDLTFIIPPLHKILIINDKEIVKYQIELIVGDYIITALNSEMELLNPPEARVEKLTQIKREVKEGRKAIQIKEAQVFKEKTPFGKSFDAFIELRNKEKK
jgi:hypothetical protein